MITVLPLSIGSGPGGSPSGSKVGKPPKQINN